MIKVEILKVQYDSPLAGYLGQTKREEFILRDFTFLGSILFIRNYIEIYDKYQYTKTQYSKPYGYLEGIPPASIPWMSISIDFIEGLPESKGYDTILVIVD